MSVLLRKAAVEQEPPLFSGVHGSFFASDVRRGERIVCTVRKSGQRTLHPFVLWRISPFGVELVCDTQCMLPAQQIVEVSLEIGGHRASYRGCVVETEHPAVSMTHAEQQERHQGRVAPSTVAIRLDTTPQVRRPEAASGDAKAPSWTCHRLFYPTGVCKNTRRWNDWISFRVTELSASGMCIVTRTPLAAFAKGLTLSVELMLPSVGRFLLEATVARAEPAAPERPKESLVALRFAKLAEPVRHAMGQYIVQFGGDHTHRPTPSVLHADGFSMHTLSNVLDFDVVRTEVEYQQVVELRSLAFRRRQKDDAKIAKHAADLYDTRSRIVVCKRQGRVVGSVRLSFLGPNDSLEEEAQASLPSRFPPKDQLVEASRVVVHPDLEGTHLHLLLMRYALLSTLQAQRRCMVHATFASMMPLFRQLGFRDTGVRWSHPVVRNTALHVMLFDVQKMLDIGPLGPLLWCASFPHLLRLVDANKSIRLGWVTRKRLGLCRLVVPLVSMFEKIHQVRRRLR